MPPAPSAYDDSAGDEPIVRKQNQSPYAGSTDQQNYWQNTPSSGTIDHERYRMPTPGTPAATNRTATYATAQQGVATSSAAGAQQAQYADANYQQGAQAWGTYVPPNAQQAGPPAATYPPAGSVPYVPNNVYSPATTGANPPYAGTGYGTQAVPLQVRPNGQVIPQYSAPVGPFGPTIGPMPENDPTMGLPTPLTDILVNVREAQTGRFMIGATVNSDAGVAGQIVIDERNFDWRRIPENFDDFVNGTAFRGGGQGLRIEALPGDEIQRYSVQFTDPYLFNTRISFNLSGYLFDRQYFDWTERRGGGKFGFGYRITPDLTLSSGFRGERVSISDVRPGSDSLDAAVGDHDLYSVRFNLIQNTRDISFQPTQGYYFSASVEQVFGTFDYTRGEIDFRRYFLISERPDGSGRHVLGFSNRVAMSGSNTPVFEHYFAGGYQTLRGFDFRRASPQENGVTVGGRLMMLGSVEYLFPITADDMLKGVAFCDYGTVEEDFHIDSDDYRVSIGAGLRISIPAMGPAPIALDIAVPVSREETDEIRQFSFSMGVSR